MSDVHLGRTSTISRKENRFDDFFKVFSDGIDIAVERNVDFILIAGDLFDTHNPKPETVRLCENILQKAKDNNIDVFCIEGNHDYKKYSYKMSWIDYLCENDLLIHLKIVYGENGEALLKEYDPSTKTGTIYKHPSGVNIIGFGWLGKNENEVLEELFKQLLGNNNIILLHAMLEKLPQQLRGIVDRSILESNKEKYLYTALGHGHTKKSYFDKVYNAGSTEYIRFNDFFNDNRGYFYAELSRNEFDNFSLTTEHIKSKKRSFRKFVIDISDINHSNFVDIVSKNVLENLTGDLNNPIIYVEFTGRIDFLYRHELPLKETEEKILEEVDAVAVFFRDKREYHELTFRGGNNKSDELSINEKSYEIMLELLINEFKDNNIIDIPVAEKITNLIWDSHEKIIEGLDETEQEVFFDKIYDALWSKIDAD